MTDEAALREKAFDDLDAIYELADASLVALDIGELESVEDGLREIKEIAEAWEVPDDD